MAVEDVSETVNDNDISQLVSDALYKIDEEITDIIEESSVFVPQNTKKHTNKLANKKTEDTNSVK